MAIFTPLGQDVLLLESVDGYEEISRSYCFTCQLLSTNRKLPVDSLIGQPSAIRLRLPKGGERYWHGLVRSARQHGRSSDFAFYSIELVPWVWFLNLSTDCRIFQHKTVPQIVEEVFAKHHSPWFEFRLTKSYPIREYCVQYRETDFNFVHRLLEEEGIQYYFEHTSEKHVMVITDAPSQNKPCPYQPFARFAALQSDAELEENTVLEFERKRSSITPFISLTDYNFEKPLTSLGVSVARDRFAEKYDYPGKYQEIEEGDRYARLRLAEEEAWEQVVAGKSNCIGFYSGTRFSLLDHERADLNQNYTLVRLVHEARDSFYRTASTQKEGADFEYSNSFLGIPHSVAFLPQRLTPKPIVRGSQTAVVVGPKAEKLYPDKYGRVKVQFFWDRLGNFDEKSSCWIRVSTPWAGEGWGGVQIPRIGQEVIVDFLEGDPDRPIITGRVYNAVQKVPYELPAKKNKAGTKSKSVNSGGYNEISLDDSDDGEQIIIHAQKDMNTVVENDETVHVKHDRTETVDNNETITIGNNRAESVGVDEKITIGNNRTETVKNNESVTVENNRNHSISSHDVLTVGQTRTESVGINEMINVGAAQQVNVGGLRLVTVGVAQLVNVGVKHTLNAGSEVKVTAPVINIEASTSITLKCGGSTIVLEPGGITIKGPLVKINC